MTEERICAIVVTHNRQELLRECVGRLRAQSRPVNCIIVVNNGSSDGTAAWLAEQPDIVTITQHDTGSAGGQATGIREGFRLGHQWLWCMDDDTIPNVDALQKLTESFAYREPDTGFLQSLAYRGDGQINSGADYLEKMRPRADRGVIPLPNGSWVSVLIRREAVAQAGLPFKEFFIDWCDIEYTQRVLDAGFKGYFVLDSVVTHKTKPRLDPNAPFSDWEKTRFYCFVRNSVVTFRLRRRRSLPGKMVRIGWVTAKCIRAITKRQVPPWTLKAVYEGLRMRPVVEYP